MGKSKGKSSKVDPDPPVARYPASPHMVGLDWIDMPVSHPRTTADLWLELGFQARTTVGRYPRVALGGLVVRLVPAGDGAGDGVRNGDGVRPGDGTGDGDGDGAGDDGRPSGGGRRSGSGGGRRGGGGRSTTQPVTFHVAVDDIEAKRAHVVELELRPEPIRANRRGDRSFKVIDPDGYAFHFSGPDRRV